MKTCEKCGRETANDYGYTEKNPKGEVIKNVVLCADCCEDFQEEETEGV